MTSTPAAALPMDASGVARYGSCIPHEEASVTKSELIEAPADKSGSTTATAALVVDTRNVMAALGATRARVVTLTSSRPAVGARSE